VNQLFKILSEILEFNQAPELSKDESEKIIRHSVMNNEKARSVLGFYPDYTLEDGLQETLEHYQQLQY
jgi:UDP-glucose 4-epimerase